MSLTLLPLLLFAQLVFVGSEPLAAVAEDVPLGFTVMPSNADEAPGDDETLRVRNATAFRLLQSLFLRVQDAGDCLTVSARLRAQAALLARVNHVLLSHRENFASLRPAHPIAHFLNHLGSVPLPLVVQVLTLLRRIALTVRP
jgi:hypothetical protein